MKPTPYIIQKIRESKMKKEGKYANATPKFELTHDYKEKVRANSYLGKKGYTIPKSILEKDDEAVLRHELFVKPEMFSGVGVPTADSAFPVYRESSNKMYIPRFYGIQRYGPPDRSELSEGLDINLDFDKELREIQVKVVDIYQKHVTSNQQGGGGILELPCGFGKTICALKIISLLKKKTIVIVHKEFLMNQWIERIQEFLPNAKIGKIQGQVVDIEGKDIVLGMIQSIYDKEYDDSIFSQFGLTIVDEVHRIGSEQFSKTLLKLVTPCMLGISATVDRKDKLTKVLFMFIGDKLYSQVNRSQDPVCVRGITYVSQDPVFNETEYDFRGNPQYSKMIVKVCDHGPRSDFIVKVIQDLVEEQPKSQIMVIGHNRSLLTYIYEALEHKAFATVGYYVGGMKQSQLQESESKQIILCTYMMAAEGLDIKGLSTLVMVTSKTDIIQTVGRILRVKHEKPIIVDIIDTHEVFEKQWKQRLRYYRKCNYRIRTINSKQYKTMSLDWDLDKTWKWAYEPKAVASIQGCGKGNPKKTDSGDDEDADDDGEENEQKIKKAPIGQCLINIGNLDLSSSNDLINYF